MRTVNITHIAFLFSSFIHIALLSINQDIDKPKYEISDKVRVRLVSAVDNREIEKKEIVKRERKGIVPVNKSNIKSAEVIKPAEDFLETKIAGETTHSPTEETYTPEESPVISKIRQSEDTAKDSIEGVSEIITEDETLISQRDTKDNENKWGDETSVHRQEEQDFPLISSFSNARCITGKR